MPIRKIIICSICVLMISVLFVLSSVTGCAFENARNVYYKITDKVKCDVSVNEDKFIVDYDGENYILLDETLPSEELGKWVGYINQNINGYMFWSVFLDKTEGMIDVLFDGEFYRAVEEDKKTEQQKNLEISKLSLRNDDNADSNDTNKKDYYDMTIEPEDINRLICDGKTYQVTEEKVSSEEMASHVGDVNKVVLHDINTGNNVFYNTIKDLYDDIGIIDWDGAKTRNKEIIEYKEVKLIKDSDDMAVKKNNEYYRVILE